LFANGVIQFNYQAVSVSGAVIGLSPGKGAALALPDLSQQTTPAFFPGSGGLWNHQFCCPVEDHGDGGGCIGGTFAAEKESLAIP
jgi:hypothetical protein